MKKILATDSELIRIVYDLLTMKDGKDLPMGLHGIPEAVYDLIKTVEIYSASADRARLDFLDKVNKRFNKTNGTEYGWKLSFNHNRILLDDSNIHALSVRKAIDIAMDKIRGENNADV